VAAVMLSQMDSAANVKAGLALALRNAIVA
jgi:hypothetical protein